MRGRFDVREIEDIGDAALSYNEVKALATGSPLLMEKPKPTPSSPASNAPNEPTTAIKKRSSTKWPRLTSASRSSPS